MYNQKKAAAAAATVAVVEAVAGMVGSEWELYYCYRTKRHKDCWMWTVAVERYRDSRMAVVLIEEMGCNSRVTVVDAVYK